MRVGLTLSGDNLSEDGARFAAQLGVTDVVVHFNDYAAGPGCGRLPARRGGGTGPQGLPGRRALGLSRRWPASRRCWRATA